MEKIEQTKSEQKEKEPTISYHFFYSPHTTAEDFKNLESAFHKADIYVPETYAWFPDVETTLEAISNGLISPEEMGEAEGSAGLRELEIIYNSKKPILLADIQMTEVDLIRKNNIGEQALEAAVSYFWNGEFRRALEGARIHLNCYAEAFKEREEKIKINLKNKLKTFLAEHPEYAKKKELQVLIQLGAMHTSISHRLKHENLPVSREFSQPIIVYPFLGEALRKIIFGKQIDDELLAKGLIDYPLIMRLKRISNDTNKITRVVRKLLAPLRLQDTEQISKNSSQSRAIDISEELEKFNIKIPRSEEEMDEMLGINKK